MSFDHFLMADQKDFFYQSQHSNLLFLQLEEMSLVACSVSVILK